jgi:hypothetical protein
MQGNDQMMARRGLAVLLIALLTLPAAASPSPNSPTVAAPIGTISQSDSAIVGGAGALPGTTVFSGDMIEVGARGSAWILLSGGRQVRVSSHSRIRLHGLAGANRVEMEIFSGAARFLSGEKAPVVAHLADATVQTKGAQPAVGLISLLSRRSAIISSEKGELLVSTAHDLKSLTLREGEAVEVTLAEAPTQEEAPTKKKRRGAGALIFTGHQVAIIGVVLAAALTVIGIRKDNDSRNLTLQEKKDAVSPFKFP